MWRAWLLVCLCLPPPGTAEQPPLVNIAQGGLQGVFLHTREGRKISAFQGIPYASPPVGPLRFQKPLAAGSWEGVRNASYPGSLCIQVNSTANVGVIGSEDCLYLNVYTHKASNESKTPVLVFIHGGGFKEGWGHEYQPDFLMDKDIVLVTLNYRLGALGFLSMEDRELPGNNGLKDQVAALQWLQDNIAEFGGDPGAVTLCGDSAGAASVHYHMLSPLSKGLFHRAISQSGSAYCPWATHHPGSSREATLSFATQVGCNQRFTQDLLDCLRDMPGYILVEVANAMHAWHQDPAVLFAPAIEPDGVEGGFLTTDPWKLSSDLPWIAGLTSAEGIFKVQTFSERHIVELNEQFEILGPLSLFFQKTAEDPQRTALSIKKFYFLDGDIKLESSEGLEKMYSDSWFVYPIKESFRRHRGPKYFYYFEYRGANSLAPNYTGVSHFDDMQYFFPMENKLQNFNKSEEDLKLSKKLINIWTSFVIHGNPTADSSDVTWTESITGAEFLRISRSGFTMDKGLLEERDKFWGSLPYRDKYDLPAKDEL